jgi:preprotein translocase SecE subunit
MATAVETPPQSDKAAGPALGLVPASVVGAVLVLAAALLVGYGLPRAIDGVVKIDGPVPHFLRALATIAAVVAVVILAFRVAGPSVPKGIRGGVFLTVCCILGTFVLGRAVGLWLDGSGFAGQLVAALVAAGLVYGSYKLLAGARGRRWMLALESQGWFSTFSYKRSQGQRVRKWTMIGFLLVGGTGVYAVVHQSMLPSGDWNPRIPFTDDLRIPLLSDVPYTAPILLIALTIWFAWRAVNVPPFADFLIATEAEMNKVSWTPWRKLVKDTVVVLVFTGLLTAFLLTVDLFWGWTLSHPWVGVLPEKSDKAPKNPAGELKDW